MGRRRNRREAWAWSVLLTAALAARLVDLDARPFHHDEAQIGYFAWVLLETGDYEYDPLLHGPLIYYSTALAHLVAGTSDFSTRLVPALAGVALTGLPFFLREALGRGGAWVAAALLAFAPTALYYTRFGREDALAAALTLGILAVCARALDRPARWQPPAAGALLALAFAQKESAYLTVAILAPPLVVAAVRDPSWRQSLRRLGSDPWVLGLVLFAAIYCSLYSSLFTHPAGVWDGLYGGPKYWLEQHGVNRGGEPWFFHLLVLGLVEPVVLWLGAAGAVIVARRRARGPALILWFALGSLAAYSFAGERFPWLTLHALVPLCLVAGLGAQALWGARRRAVGAAALAVAAAGAAYLTFASWSVNSSPTDPRELLVSVPSAPDVLAVRDHLLETAPTSSIEVDTRDTGGFPWAWYLRDSRVGYVDIRADGYRPRADVLIAGAEAAGLLRSRMSGYTACGFRFRVFWRRDYGRLTPRRALRWMVTREPWSPMGSSDAVLYLRARTKEHCPPGLARAPGGRG